MQAKAERRQQPAAKQMALSSTLLVSFTICSKQAKDIGGVHRRHRSGPREVHPVSRLAAGSRQGNVLETGEGERGGSEGPSGQRRACLSRAPCNPPTGKAAEASPERKSASCADRQAAGCLKKNRQAVGGGWRRPTWLLAGQARREAPGQKAGEVVGREKHR